MDREPDRLTDLALVGHQESWAKLGGVVQALREPGLPPLTEAQLRDLVPWIRPGTAMRVAFSSPGGERVRGIYVETFIAPEELAAGAFHQAIEKVRAAVACAAREGARLAALGGFTSIVLEGEASAARAPAGIALTTGNTLTAALIIKGVEAAAARLSIDLARATVLVVGSTGDIGSACARHLGRRTRRLLLSARNPHRLREQEASLRKAGIDASANADLRAMLGEAEVIICAASLAAPALDASHCRPRALICDAGYPKNVRIGSRTGPDAPYVFSGGMGQCSRGWERDAPGDDFYSLPVERVMHGCMLEGVALALEGRFEPFSQGRGRITPERIDEIWNIASRHGIGLAPLFGPQGVWA